MVLLLVCSCQTPRPKRLPPLPGTQARSAKDFPPVAKDLPPRKAFLTLAWDNQPNDEAAYIITGIEGTTNLLDWYEVARVPHVTNGSCTLTNRPPWEFYRAFNAYTNYEKSKVPLPVERP